MYLYGIVILKRQWEKLYCVASNYMYICWISLNIVNGIWLSCKFLVKALLKSCIKYLRLYLDLHVTMDNNCMYILKTASYFYTFTYNQLLWTTLHYGTNCILSAAAAIHTKYLYCSFTQIRIPQCWWEHNKKDFITAGIACYCPASKILCFTDIYILVSQISTGSTISLPQIHNVFDVMISFISSDTHHQHHQREPPDLAPPSLSQKALMWHAVLSLGPRWERRGKRWRKSVGKPSELPDRGWKRPKRIRGMSPSW